MTLFLMSYELIFSPNISHFSSATLLFSYDREKTMSSLTNFCLFSDLEIYTHVRLRHTDSHSTEKTRRFISSQDFGSFGKRPYPALLAFSFPQCYLLLLWLLSLFLEGRQVGKKSYRYFVPLSHKKSEKTSLCQSQKMQAKCFCIQLRFLVVPRVLAYSPCMYDRAKKFSV